MLDDGTAITESLAILQYIADAFPDAELVVKPDDLQGRAQINEALAELVSDVHKAWAPVFVPGRFVISTDEEASARQAAFRQLDLQYARLDGLMQGRHWRVLGRRTVADAYLYVMCSWKDKTPTPLAVFQNLADFKSRLDADSDVIRAQRYETPA